MSLGFVTLSYGATSVTLYGIDPKTIYPNRVKSYSEYTLEDGSKAVDEAENSKRFWSIKQDPPLTAQEDTDLDSLCYTHKTITLTESWVDSGSYTVHFRKLKRFKNGPSGRAHYEMEFQEL